MAKKKIKPAKKAKVKKAVKKAKPKKVANKVRKKILNVKKIKKPKIKKGIFLPRGKKVAKKKKPVKVVKKKIIAKKKVIAKKKPVSNSRELESKKINDFPAENFFKARIKVIGIGGGGGSIVSEIGRSLEKASFVIADTDIRALKKKGGIKYFWFGEELTHGLGTGVNVDLAKEAAESAKEKISQNFKDQDIIIFIASLGGGLGSGATQVFAEEAKKFGGITFGIFTMPFKFEGKNKYKIAQNALKSLKQSLNVSLVIPNEKIFKVIDANTPITNAFSLVNKSLIESLESLIDLIYTPGIINIDFADLRTILKGRGNSAFLNTVEKSGKDRADKICESVLTNPLLQGNNFKAEKILFNVAGSENLSMFEVERVSSHISKSNPEAKIIFGISKNSKLRNKIKTTILMTGGKVADEKEKEIVKKEVVKPEKIKKPEPVKKPEVAKAKKPKPKIKKAKKPVLIPVPKIEIPAAPALARSKIKIEEEEMSEIGKKAIRRSGLEIKKAEEQEAKKKLDQEKEWEIPAFLRRVKFNK